MEIIRCVKINPLCHRHRQEKERIFHANIFVKSEPDLKKTLTCQSEAHMGKFREEKNIEGKNLLNWPLVGQAHVKFFKFQ